MKEVEKSLDPQLWHACAGGMIQLPLPDSNVYYFPQGHAEHTLTNVDFTVIPRVPPFFLCKVISVKFMADMESDEVYAKITLNPLQNSINPYNDDDEDLTSLQSHNGSESSSKPSSFAKTLTQSDANNGGGFSVPRCCAETIFPKLDYSSDPPVQLITAKDVHGETWRFRHIYRGTPRRHLLTTGWSTFVNQKKLIAGDSVVFMRSQSNELYIGIRRAKRGSLEGWSSSSSYNRINMNYNCKGKVKGEDVIEAVSFAFNGEPFEVSYYPRASTPEFIVKSSSLISALSIQWCHGLRFKMAFETEDSSRISWFMGTVSSVQVLDPFLWPNSPWRLLQVSWDEPDLLQNVKRVSPWLVELLPNMPLIHLTPFSPHRKKLRLPQPPDLLPFSNPSSCQSDIQGARHGRFEVPFSDLDLTKIKRFNSDKESDGGNNNDDISCLLTIGSGTSQSVEKVKTPLFLLFGQPIHID